MGRIFAAQNWVGGCGVVSFHDEFFRSRGTKHDELMLKCIEKIEDIAVWRPLPDKIFVRACGEGDKFRLGTTLIDHDFMGCESCSRHKNCPNNWTSTKQKIENEVDYSVRCIKHSYETEVLCKNGSFIMGYADMVIKTERVVGIITAVEFNKTTCSIYPFYNLKEDIYTIVEVKPELNDIGAIIRQLKTYKEILSKTELRDDGPIAMVIATPVEVTDAVEKYLLHEGINVYKIEATCQPN
jgi:hypothetical protein